MFNHNQNLTSTLGEDFVNKKSLTMVHTDTSTSSHMSDNNGYVLNVINSNENSDLEINATPLPDSISLTSEHKKDDITSSEHPDGSKKLKESIKPRHTKMIAMATGIGTGLLVATGGQISIAGVGGTLISYLIVSIMIVLMFYSCSEIVVAFPNINYIQYSKRFIDPGVGFAVSWVYCFQWMTTVPLELITASMTIKYWNQNISPSIFVTVFYIFILSVAFCGARGYAEAEFVFNTCKVLMLIGFVILGIILSCGGLGTQPVQEASKNYYVNPGAFNTNYNVVKTICSTLLSSTFASGGVELVALTVIEQDKTNLAKSIRTVSAQIILRMLFLILLPLTVIGFLVPYTSNELLGSDNASVHSSPFVIAIYTHGIKVIPSIINAVIIIAVLSVGNSAVYTSSRSLRGLALQGYAPKYFTELDKNGRPMRALYVTFSFGFLSYLAEFKDQELIFQWLVAIGGISSIFIWTIICISHIRFRYALKKQSMNMNELGVKSPTGLIGSYISVGINILIICLSFWASMWPVGKNGETDVINCLQSNLAIVVALVCYIGYKTYTKTWGKWYLKAEEIDITTDRAIYYFDPVLQKKVAVAAVTTQNDHTIDENKKQTFVS